MTEHIEAEAKWYFADDIFSCIFFNEESSYFELKFTEVCYQKSNSSVSKIPVCTAVSRSDE